MIMTKKTMMILVATICLLTCGHAFFSVPSTVIKSTTIRQPFTPFNKVFSKPFKQMMILKGMSDDEMEKYLDDMIYSGDMSGYLRKYSKELISAEFKDYIEDIIGEVDDEDEKEAIGEALQLLKERLRLTDGISDSGVVFEKRLDRILFTPPNARRDYIRENIIEMTDGFIEYVQRELKEMSDPDNKVVLASVLQMIGQMKNADLLGADVTVLTQADASLGDEYAKKTTLEGSASNIMNINEQILAGLMFSTNDVLEDVLNNLHVINDDFIQYLQKKVESCNDMEERVGLASLLQVITTVIERVKEAEGDDVTREEELSIDQIRERMQEVQLGQEIKPGEVKTASKKEGFVVQSDQKDTFAAIMKRFDDSFSEGMDLPTAVKANYELCDYRFMEMLKSEAEACRIEGADIEAQSYLDMLDAISKEMANRVGIAQEKLQIILGKGNPKAMESEIVRMARKGEIDEALVLLIEANVQQAKTAGATAAAEVLDKLVKRAREETERKLPEEQKLLRALLRIQLSEDRKGLLYEAFRPTKSMNEDGEVIQGAPLIAPPAFISIVKQFIQNFGNVEGFDIMGKAQDIIAEAETVATELYGERMTPRMQQEMMFKKNTISVWDLGNYEDYATMTGEDVPWRNDKYDTQSPEDVLGSRVKKIGGADGI